MYCGWVGRLVVIAMCVAGCGRYGFDASGDASTGDGAGADAAIGSCDLPRKLCDGFEGTTLDAKWTPTTTGISLDPTRAHRGSSSLHAHTNPLAVGQDGYAQIVESALLPQADQTIYVRVWTWWDQMPLNNMGLIGAVQRTGNQTQDGVFIIPVALTVYSQFEGRSFETPGPPALSTWLCLQWTIVRSQTNGSLTLAGDAGPATLSNVQTEGTSGLVDFELGIAFAGTSVNDPQPAMDAWFDDLIVSTSPVSCAD